MYGRMSLTDIQVAEVYYLTTEGCPCCKIPLRNDFIAKAYNTSSSTVSRIRNLKQANIPDSLPYTRKELVELRKRVKEAGQE